MRSAGERPIRLTAPVKRTPPSTTGAEAGSRLATRLARHDPTANHVLRGIDREIDDDKEQLQRLMDKLGIRPSALNRMSPPAGELGNRVKLRPGHVDEPSASWLLALEALTAGVETKRRLWPNLQSIADIEPRLRIVDLDGLLARAVHQLRVLDECRAEIVRTALTH
jgi:hypothetical protein